MAHEESALDSSELTMSTSSIVYETLAHAPRRSLTADENVKIPPNINNRQNECCCSLPSYEGMSGGPILRCKMHNNTNEKACVVIGTLWGAERIFVNNNGIEEIEKFGSFINRIPLT